MKKYKFLSIFALLSAFCALTPAFLMDSDGFAKNVINKSQKLHSFHDLEIEDGSLYF